MHQVHSNHTWFCCQSKWTNSLVVMVEMLPIVGFVGFEDGATTIGGTAATGGAGVPIFGLLGGVVVIMSDFLFLVVWSVDCA